MGTAAPLCDTISSEAFHSTSTRTFSNSCVQALVGNPKYEAYRRYKAYHSQLYLLWVLLIPILSTNAVVLCFFYRGDDSSSMIAGFPWLLGLTIISVFYALPASMLLSVVGFFGYLSFTEAFSRYIFLTLVMAFLSFLNRANGNAENSSFPERIVLGVMGDCVSMQGFLVGCCGVAWWRSMFWERMIKIPRPLLFAPTLVGVVGVFFSHFIHQVLTYELYLNQISFIEFIVGQPEVFISMKHFLHPFEVPHTSLDFYSHPQTFLCVSVLIFFFFVVAVVNSVIFGALNEFITVLPRHPTTWGLSVLGTCGAVVFFMIFQKNVWIAADVILLFSLLYNGFVA